MSKHFIDCGGVERRETVAGWAMRRFEGRWVLPYVLAQLAGAALGSGLV